LLPILAHRVTATGLALACAAVLGRSHPTIAQTFDEVGEEEITMEVPDGPAYADGHVWVSAGVRSPIVSIARTAEGSILALTARGGVIRISAAGDIQESLSSDRGTFESDGDLDEEDILMDAEGLMEEIRSLIDERDGDPTEDEEEDNADDEVSSETSPVDESESVDSMAEMADLWVGDERGDGADLGPRSGAVIWASTAVTGVAVVSRTDGLWVSTDDGLTWSKGGSVPRVHAFADGHAGHFLAGTEAGLRISTDQGQTWEKVNDPIVDVEVFAFAQDGGRIYAGTTEGLFRSEDGLRWAKTLSRYDTDVPVWSIAVDPHWVDGLWVTGPVGVLRSDDGGELLRATSRNMLPGTVSLLALDHPGHILAAGLDGVWESTDGGVRWRPVANGLPSSANRLLLDGPIVAGVDGMFALKIATEEPDTFVEAVESEPASAAVGILVATALNRPGMDMDNVLTHGSFAQSLLLPSLQINARRTVNRHITGDYDARSNRGASRGVWAVGVTACFGACSGSSSQSVADLAVSGDNGSLYETVTVVGDEVYSISEPGSLAPMAANVSERLTQYRTDIAGVVGELALVRLRLIDARRTVRSLSLREQVKHQIDVLEATARLDVYTNGYLSRVLDGS